MGSKVTYTLLDVSNEKSNFSIAGPALTGANYDAQIAEVSGIRAALDAITLATVSKEDVLSKTTTISEAKPGSPYAQRELKILVRYHGVVNGKKYTLSIAAPDLGALDLESNGENILLDDSGGDGYMADFVSAFEGFATPPDDDTDTVVIDEAIIVGRNI